MLFSVAITESSALSRSKMEKKKCISKYGEAGKSGGRGNQSWEALYETRIKFKKTKI